MNLLLSNDDGFDSEGLNILAKKLSEKHKVFIIAPDSNRSAVSHHITMVTQNNMTKLADNIWSCTGYPVDCVFTGLESNILGVKIDGVVSGINRGANMGTDIVYSGTCAVARQAVLSGVPGIAVSLDPVSWETVKTDGMKYEALAKFTADNIEKLLGLAKITPPRAFVNINAISVDSYKGVRFADKPCVREYGDKTIVVHDKDDKYHTEFVMGSNKTPVLENTDFGICRNGYIAISLVYADPIFEEIAKIVDYKDFSL